MSNDNNAVPDLLELLLRVVNSGTKAKIANLHVDMRIARVELECPDGLCFAVGLKRVWLSLDVTGLAPLPGSRYGEPTRPNETSLKQKFVSESTVESQTGSAGELRLNASPGANINAKFGAKEKTKNSVTSTALSTHTKVKARANLKWEITESPDLDHLDGTYLNDDVLCRASVLAGANSKSVQLDAYAPQKDVTLELKSHKNVFSWPSKNHEKMLKVLIAKAIAGSAVPYSGIVTLSRSGVEIED